MPVSRHAALHRWQRRDPDLIRRLMPFWGWLFHHYFRVVSDGWEHIPPEGQLLFVGSHNGGLAAPDMHMVMYDWFRRFGLKRRVLGLAHPKVWMGYPPLADLASRTGAIPYHPRLALAALEQGESLLVYPGGGQDTFRPTGTAAASISPAAPASCAWPSGTTCRSCR